VLQACVKDRLPDSIIAVMLAEIAPDPDNRKMLLVGNPARLYWPGRLSAV
jgi:predicted TIM-barrel fold metal-dependent hydrolase